MARRLPPLNSLRAFEAAARNGSFARAAKKLCVTQGAVSHQVKSLEAVLDCRMFDRIGRRIALTRAGRSYFEIVRDSFDRLSAGTECLINGVPSRGLTVSTSPDFAAKWLVPRLGGFVQANPTIEIRVDASRHQVDFATEDIDIAIRHGDGRWLGLNFERLFAQEMLFPVCSPALRARFGRFQSPQDLRHAALISVGDRQGWRTWLGLAGLKDVTPSGPIFNRASFAIDAAIEGHGVALARSTLVTHDLRSGRLIRPFSEPSIPVASGYWIVSPASNADNPSVQCFTRWLHAQARSEEVTAN